MIRISLTKEELELIIEALYSFPDVENYSFGPSYERVKGNAQKLRQKLKEKL